MFGGYTDSGLGLGFKTHDGKEISTASRGEADYNFVGKAAEREVKSGYQPSDYRGDTRERLEDVGLFNI